MTWQGFAQFFIFFGLVLTLAPLGGLYLDRVYNHRKTPLDFLLEPLERFIYRLCHIDAEGEQHWSSYALSLLALSLTGIAVVVIFLLLQKFLPLNPDKLPGLGFLQALDTAIAAVTNTGWHYYIPEKTLSHFSRMAIISVQCFLSGAMAMAVAVALVRGLSRMEERTIGNFWVDITRSILWILLPLCLIAAVILIITGVPQNFSGAISTTPIENITQKIAEGPVASQVAIKLAASSGMGVFAASSAHPYENPGAFSNFFELLLMLFLPVSFINFFGRQVGDKTKGMALLVVMGALFITMVFTAYWAENQPNPLIEHMSMDQLPSRENIGGNLEGKEVRFGTAGSVLWAVTATSTANASLNAAHDSMMPLTGLVLLTDLLLNETVFGGAGSGLYKILVFVIITAFVANLLTGKVPEYLGKKIEPRETGWLVLALAAGPAMTLGFSSLAMLAPGILRAISNPGPHGLSQVVYDYGSAAANNGSAFAGFDTATPWNSLAMSISMLVSRYLVMICILGLAGSFVLKKRVAISGKSFSTNSTTFVITLLLMLIICTALAYLPVLVMGPMTEHLLIIGKRSL